MVSSTDESSTDASVEKELNGNTLSVYWFMIRENKSHSAREIQRQVGLSSSSLALHHLNKLIDLGYVMTDEWGGYVVARRVRTGLLSLFVGYGRFFVPRFAVYASVWTGFLVSYLLLLTFYLNPAGLVLLAGHALVAAVLWFEAVRAWRLQPL